MLIYRYPLSFTSSSKTRSGLCGSFSSPSARLVFRLSERPVNRPNFLSCGFPKIAPPLTFTIRVRSQSFFRRRAPFGLVLPSTRHLPPMSFLPASAVYSANCSAGLFRPAASHGVRAVSGPVSLPLCRHMGWSSEPFSGPHLTPFEAFPSLVAVLRHRSRCLLAVVPYAVSSARYLDLKALLHHRVRCDASIKILTRRPMLPWA